MRENENTSLLTPRVTLVPYEARHVAKYHRWMSDEVRILASAKSIELNWEFWQDIQAATASEPLTLDEEYENQASWRTSHDKLTFIICQPLANSTDVAAVTAGDADADERMIGDVNFFLYPYDDDDDEEPSENELVGEIDVMVAEKSDRGRSVGFGAVTALMSYVYRNLDAVLEENSRGAGGDASGKPVLRGLMAKIQAGNDKSVALFKRVGFTQKGGVNYFGEIKMVLDDFVSLMEPSSLEGKAKLQWRGEEVAQCREVKYSRPSA